MFTPVDQSAAFKSGVKIHTETSFQKENTALSERPNFPRNQENDRLLRERNRLQ